MFDLLHETLVFDPGKLFADQLGCFSAFRKAAANEYPSWSSVYKGNKQVWEKSLTKMINTLG
jgi:hypothetical protein